MSSTPTPSLHHRAVLTVLGLFALLLLVVGVAVDLALGEQLQRALVIRLLERAERAQELTASGVAPEEFPTLLGGRDIRIRVTMPDGGIHGDPGLDPAIVGPFPEAPPPTCPDLLCRPQAPSVAPADRRSLLSPEPPGPASIGRTLTLPDGTKVLLVADTTQITDVRRHLRLIMTAAGAATLIVAAVLLSGAIGQALRPLDRLTGLARGITSGNRGQRLRPDRAQTELGRAATAFDGMLDALESTEHRAQDEAARAEVAAEHARRAERQTRRFLADAAHELRTPLAGIQAVAEQLARADDRRQARRAELLMRETARTARLVDDLLDIARIDSGLRLELAEVDLGELLDAEARRTRELAPSLAVKRTGHRSGVVRADAMRISQILSNLTDNARRHTPAGGTITLHLANSDERVTVTVTDTGPGIPDGERERIFERLVRLGDARDRDSGGAGLGLAIARGLARAHGGTLVCLPTGAGAAFRLDLPRPPARPRESSTS